MKSFAALLFVAAAMSAADDTVLGAGDTFTAFIAHGPDLDEPKEKAYIARGFLDELRGRAPLTTQEQFNLIANARAGQDYPNLATIPVTSFNCADPAGPGFYADVETNCQVFRRCHIDGNMTSFLCPNMTVFNQITLVCTYFFDVDCTQATKFYAYANSRLYLSHPVPLLDDQEVYKFDEFEAQPLGGRRGKH